MKWHGQASDSRILGKAAYNMGSLYVPGNTPVPIEEPERPLMAPIRTLRDTDQNATAPPARQITIPVSSVWVMREVRKHKI